MASELKIKTEIESQVAHYSKWTIGITDDPSRRWREHDYPAVWYQWDVDSEQVARNVERYFLDKGMQGATGGGGGADYVYIFYSSL